MTGIQHIKIGEITILSVATSSIVATASRRRISSIEASRRRISFTQAQAAEIAAITNDKRRGERTATYHLINHAATLPGFEKLHGALLGHHPNGAPYLCTSDGHPIDIAISISHCRTAVCIAFGPENLRFGIDIEDPTARLARVADKFLTEDEQKLIIPADRHNHTEATDLLLEAWTTKEAAYKAASTPDTPLTLRNDIKITDITCGEATATINGIRCRSHFLRHHSACIALAVETRCC